MSGLGNGRAVRTPVTIVCVFNDPDVLDRCLARSVREGRESAPGTELIAIDNRGNPYPSAGAALNEGARQAKNDVVAFVHQDVVLHSLTALEEAAGMIMTDPGIGILGAIGVDAGDRLIGRIRDRVVRVGAPAATPQDVESLDEVLLVVRRAQLMSEPLSEHPRLAWHAYGVEYCARMRRRGLRAVALDIPLTHNSLTTNLKDLDLAHAYVGQLHRELLPLRTTCGTVWPGGAPRGGDRLRHFARRARVWWSESAVVKTLARSGVSSEPVIVDVRFVIDAALERGGLTALRVIDLDVDDPAAVPVAGLLRFGRAYATSTCPAARARGVIDTRADDELLLFTASDVATLAALGPLDEVPHVAGHAHGTGAWLAMGVPAAVLRPLWARRRNRPVTALRPPRRVSTVPSAA